MDSPAPSIDLLSFTFEYDNQSQDVPVSFHVGTNALSMVALSVSKILVDAYDTSRSISRKTARKTVQALIAGLQANGLERGDCVCIHAFNDVGISNGLERTGKADIARSTIHSFI